LTKRLRPNGQKWLKCFHVLSAGVWVGTAVTLVIKQFFITPSQGPELFGVLSTLNFIDLCILVPGAMGTLVTALIYSIWTNWGWFRHRCDREMGDLRLRNHLRNLPSRSLAR